MDFVEQVKSNVDIVKTIGDYVRLKRMGASGRYVGLCPFHTEKTGSFNVHRDRGFYKCFGCDAKGDIFTFIQQYEGVSFYEALKLLAERNGMQMPRRNEYTDPDTKIRGALHELHELAAKQFRATLAGPQGSEARAYLTRRGVSPETAEEFGLGLADGSGQTLVRLFGNEGFTVEQMEASGLVKRRESGGHYDAFRTRLMFPIHNQSGKLIAFGGRTLEAENPVKYINSPETPIYVKSHVLYNLHRAKQAARKNERMVLVEGYMDAIGVWAAGIHEVVASCGTALTNQQVRAIKGQAEKVNVAFDPDAAGEGGQHRSINLLLDEGVSVYVFMLDNLLDRKGGSFLDPDAFILEHGVQAFQEKLERAEPYFAWLIDRKSSQFDGTPEGRVKLLKTLMPDILKRSDKFQRAAVVNYVAQRTGIDASLIMEEVRRSAGDRSAPQKPVSTIPHIEKLLLHVLLGSVEARHLLIPRLETTGAMKQFQTHRVFETMLPLYRSKPDFQFPELEARLEDADKGLMASLVFADEPIEEEVLLKQAEAFLATFAGEERKTQVADLKGRIRSAERAGDLAEALRLMNELNRMAKA